MSQILGEQPAPGALPETFHVFPYHNPLIRLCLRETRGGSIVRYELVSSDESLQLNGELIEISGGHTEQFQDAEIVLLPEYPENDPTDGAAVEAAPDLPDNIESSRTSPVVTQRYYYGEASLAGGETDFYEITVPAGSNVKVFVFAFVGVVELEVFGTDPDFADATHQEIGADITIELAVSPEERVLYFTISAAEPAAYQLYLGDPEDE